MPLLAHLLRRIWTTEGNGDSCLFYQQNQNRVQKQGTLK